MCIMMNCTKAVDGHAATTLYFKETNQASKCLLRAVNFHSKNFKIQLFVPLEIAHFLRSICF